MHFEAFQVRFVAFLSSMTKLHGEILDKLKMARAKKSEKTEYKTVVSAMQNFGAKSAGLMSKLLRRQVVRTVEQLAKEVFDKLGEEVVDMERRDIINAVVIFSVSFFVASFNDTSRPIHRLETCMWIKRTLTSVLT